MNEILTRLPTPDPQDRAIAGVLLEAQRLALEMIIREEPLGDILSYLTSVVEKNADRDVYAAILLLDSEGKLRAGAAPRLPPHYNAAVDGLTAQEGLGTCSHAAVTQEVVLTPDIANDPGWATIKHLPLDIGMKAAWSQPIISGSGKTLATFGTYFKECRKPTPLERQLVAMLAHTAAVAIERKSAEDERRQRERILHRALDAAQMGTWRYTFADDICTCSPLAQKLYGLSDPRWVHDEVGVQPVLHPDDIAMMWASVERACAPGNDGYYDVEYRVRKPEGGWRWLKVWGVVEHGDDAALDLASRPVALVGASRDITDIKEAQTRQELLLNELNHRVKNTLAIVQAIGAQTHREHPEPEAFMRTFSERLGSLARTHTILWNAKWNDAALHDIACAVLKPFRADAIRIEGPDLTLDAGRIVPLGLILHELATNALKYGGLRESGDAVTLSWELSARQQITMRWEERCGTRPESEPGQIGFGSKLIQASAEQLGGVIERRVLDRGICCVLSFPLRKT